MATLPSRLGPAVARRLVLLSRSVAGPTSSSSLAMWCSTSAASNGQEQISPVLVDILVCPLTKEKLNYDRARNILISPTINVEYPVRDGIPCLAPADGKIVESSDKSLK